MEKIEGINLKELVEECEVALAEERELEIEEIRNHIHASCGRSRRPTDLDLWMRPY